MQRSSPWVRASVALVAIVSSFNAQQVKAGAAIPEEGGGSVSVAYQYAHVEDHLRSNGAKVDVGSIRAQSLLFQVNYGVTEHFAVYANIPYVRKSFKQPGNMPIGHRRWNSNGPTNDISYEDDGDWHGSFQDVLVAVQYQMSWGQWLVTPFMAVGGPSHEYEYFAHAAIGSYQRKFTLGVETARVLPEPFDRFFVQLGTDVSQYQKYQGMTLRRAVGTVETGYAATERLQLRVFVLGQKTFGGLDFPGDVVPFQANPELFHHHDQVQRVDFVDAGFGASYSLTGRVDMFGSFLNTLWGENGHDTDYLITVGLSRWF